MKKEIAFIALFACLAQAQAQINPVIKSWLFNTTDLKGRHYVQGNPTPIQDNSIANVQSAQYSTDWVYVRAAGVPAYITGPFLDGNPSITQPQNGYFKLPLNPVANNGTPTNTTGGNIGVFINGVALFDYRDGVSWQNASQSLKGGPLGGMGDNVWTRDAVVAERQGFDCAKGHPAMGNYHHHQNPSAFKLDLTVISNICDLYLADGLYVIDSTVHSPLIGFAYDGFPIYGAYGYKNTDGTGGIVRMKSAFQLRNISVRTHYANGNDVTDGPVVAGNFPLGYFREDYEYVDSAAPDVLDEHNGRFCVTPEYPQGIYAYFATVNESWNAAYPYVVGPTFYGVRSASKVNMISDAVTTYNPTVSTEDVAAQGTKITCFPNPAGEFLAIQASGLLKDALTVRLYDLSGQVLRASEILPGSTICYLDTRALYNGVYVVAVYDQGNLLESKKIVIDQQ